MRYLLQKPMEPHRSPLPLRDRNRKKRPTDGVGINVIKAEQVNGFRGNDDVEDLVRYIEGTTPKDAEFGKGKKLQQQGRKVAPPKKEKRNKSTSGGGGETNGHCTSEDDAISGGVRSEQSSVGDSEESSDAHVAENTLIMSSSPKSVASDARSFYSGSENGGTVGSVVVCDKVSSLYQVEEAKVSCDLKKKTKEKYFSVSTSVYVNSNHQVPSNSYVPRRININPGDEQFVDDNIRFAQHSAKVCDGKAVPSDDGPILPNAAQKIDNQSFPKAVVEETECARAGEKTYVEFLDGTLGEELEVVENSSVSCDFSFGFDEFFPIGAKGGPLFGDVVDFEKVVQVSAISSGDGLSTKEKLEQLFAFHDKKVSLTFKTSKTSESNETVRQDVEEFVTQRWNSFMKNAGNKVVYYNGG